MIYLMQKAGVAADFCGFKNKFYMATLFFAIVMLHLLAGFGYMMYRLNGPAKKEDTPR